MKSYIVDTVCKFFQEGYGTIKGTVIYSSDDIAILKVKMMDEGAFPLTLFYNEVMNRYPKFNIPKPSDLSQPYLCIDVENNISAHFYNCLSGSIGDTDFDDEDGIQYDNEDADALTPRLESCDNTENEYIDIDLPDDFLADMVEQNNIICLEDSSDVFIKDDGYDTESVDVIPNTDIPSAPCNVNRAVSWLALCDCAILTAWRSDPKLTRSQKDEDNYKLLKALRCHGYGVSKVRGCYVAPDYPLSKENSFFVCNIKNDKGFFDTIYSLSESFDQQCFLYKEGGSIHPAYLVGTNDKFGKGRMEIAGRLHIGKESSKAYTEFSSGRISFE